MIEEFTITVNGGSASTLKQLGVEKAALTLNSTGSVKQAEDSLRLTIRADAETTPIFAENERVELFSGGARRYVGWMPEAPEYELTQKGERQIYALESPNRFLKSTFEQLWRDNTDISVLTSGSWFGRHVFELGDTLSTEFLNLSVQLGYVLNAAQEFGNAGGPAPFAYDLTGIPSVTIPEKKMNVPSYMDVIETGAKWCPTLGWRWDYLDTAIGTVSAAWSGTSTSSLAVAGSGTKTFATQASKAWNGWKVRATSSGAPTAWMEGTASYSGTSLVMTVTASGGSGTHADWNLQLVGVPVLRFVNVTNIDSGGSLLMPPTITGSGSPVTHTIPNDGTWLVKFRPKLQGNKVRQIKIIWFHQEKTLRVDGISFDVYADSETSTVENGSIQHRSFKVMLGGYVWDGSAWVDPEGKPAAGLARLLHQGFARSWWQFNAGSRSDDLHWELRPCDLANASGAASAHATAYASVQVITRDLLSGDVNVDTGAPNQRGIADLTALKQMMGAASKENADSNGKATQSYGWTMPENGTGTGTGGGGGGLPAGSAWLNVFYMQDGTLVTTKDFLTKAH